VSAIRAEVGRARRDVAAAVSDGRFEGRMHALEIRLLAAGAA
jgi:hypothetical protein